MGEDNEDKDTEYSDLGLRRRELLKGDREREYVGLRGWEGGLEG